MSVAPNSETTHLWYLLRDGEWRDARVLRHDLGLKVHWGQAFRRTEHARAWATPGKTRTMPISIEDAVKSGRRSVATAAINNARRVGRVEVDPVPTKELWQSDTPIRIRWVGDSLLGFYTALQEEIAAAETVAQETLDAVRMLHIEHPSVHGMCAADGQPLPCMTLQVLEHGTAVFEDSRTDQNEDQADDDPAEEAAAR